MSRPSVSIVIPVLNGAATVGATLTALLHQSDAASPPEILVIDNGSTDATRSVVEGFPVTLLTEGTRGPAAARNCGLRAARGAIVAHLDADTLPTRRWLAEIAAPFADAHIQQVAGRMLPYRPSTAAERYYATRFLDREAENARAQRFPFAASGNMAVRRDALLAVGGWDESFLVGQDVDLCYRLQRRFQTPIHYQPGAAAFVRTSHSVAALRARAFKYGQARAKLWQQYPEAAAWGLGWGTRVATALMLSAAAPHLLRVMQWTGRANAAAVEQAECHRAWTWSLWRGFASMIRHREWRQLHA